MGGHRRQKDLLAAIGAAIHQHDRFAPDDLAVFADRRSDADVGVFAAEAGQHFLLPRIDQPNRTPGSARQQRRKRLQRPIELEPESASDRRHRYADVRRRHVEKARGGVLDRPRHLRRCFDMETTVLVRGDDRAWLQRKMVLPPDTKAAFDYFNIVARECSIDIAAYRPSLPRRHCRRAPPFEQDLIISPLG